MGSQAQVLLALLINLMFPANGVLESIFKINNGEEVDACHIKVDVLNQ